MKHNSNISDWLQGEPLLQDQFLTDPLFSQRINYANEGDEYLDDAIRTMDQELLNALDPLFDSEDWF
jgi:hypothetical protein